jgi:PAS domain-containing protein
LNTTEPLQLYHSWPLFESERRFDLGRLFDPAGVGPVAANDEQELAWRGIGRWECDLFDNALTWSAGVYDIFGLPRDARVTRDETVALYSEESRAAMERLRAYAIQHKRGFTLEALIIPPRGLCRWMRLTAVPICDGDRVVRLHGLKQIL